MPCAMSCITVSAPDTQSDVLVLAFFYPDHILVHQLCTASSQARQSLQDLHMSYQIAQHVSAQRIHTVLSALYSVCIVFCLFQKCQ